MVITWPRRARGQVVVSALTLLGCLGLPCARADAQERPAITDVTAQFAPGPYSAMVVDGKNADRLAVATEGGVIMWSDDGGLEVHDAEAQHYRDFDPYSWRGEQSGKALLNQEHFEQHGFQTPPERAFLLFLSHLVLTGTPPVRWYAWMGFQDYYPSLTALAIPADSGSMLAAGAGGIYRSDRSRMSWGRIYGANNPVPRDKDPLGLAVGIDPTDSHHVFAALDTGLVESFDGGQTFIAHKDPNLGDSWITKIMWDPDNPKLMFLVGVGEVLMSQDGGKSFSPSFSAQGDINDLALSAEAALVATSDGVYLATADGVKQEMKGKNVIGAIPWRDGALLVATAEELYLMTPGQRPRNLLATSEHDPFLRLGGGPGGAWLMSRDTILQIGAEVPRRKGPAPRMALTWDQFERAWVEHNQIPDPYDTRLHKRWYAALVPEIDVTVSGRLGAKESTVLDGTFPIRYRYAQANAQDRLQWEVMFFWNLSEFAFGDYSNANNPYHIIEQHVRDVRKEMLEAGRNHYRQAAQLAHQLERPPADPRTNLLWRWRLDELASYLELMSGKTVVTDINPEQAP